MVLFAPTSPKVCVIILDDRYYYYYYCCLGWRTMVWGCISPVNSEWRWTSFNVHVDHVSTAIAQHCSLDKYTLEFLLNFWLMYCLQMFSLILRVAFSVLKVSSDAVFNLDIVQLIYFFFVAWTFNMVGEFVAKSNVMKLYSVYSSSVFFSFLILAFFVSLWSILS